jgi:tRNA uridine 5-carboxymethylaminomethyl modification enzyme
LDEKRQAVEAELERLQTTRSGSHTLAQLLRRAEIRYLDLPGSNPSLSEEVRDQVEIQVKYSGYISRQEMEIERLKSFESKQIPANIDYNAIPSLRAEARFKLSQIRPLTLGQASRISGVTPADVAIVSVFLPRLSKM